MNVGACTCLSITAAMSRLDLRIGVGLVLDADRARSGHARRRADYDEGAVAGLEAVSWDVVGWACQDLNLGPLPYQGSALTD